jgi:WD40 repeat protein
LSAQFSADGQHALTVYGDDSVALWDLTSVRELFRLPPIAGVNHSRVNFSRDGSRIIIVGSTDVHEFDAATGHSMYKRESRSRDVSFSADGRRAIFQDPYSLKVVDVDNDETLAIVATGSNSEFHAQLSSNGQILMAVNEGLVRMWDARSGQQLATLASRGSILEAWFSQDGSHVITKDQNASVSVYDVALLVESADSLRRRACKWLLPWQREFSDAEIAANGRREQDVIDDLTANANLCEAPPPAGH